MNKQKIYNVSELTAAIKSILEGRFPFISVTGEISNLRRPASGHLYFTLKDDNAQIKTVLFKMQQRYLEKQPRDGQMVVCRGRLSVYQPRGDYQLIVDALDFHGSGALQLAFEQLKKKLAAEGLFAQEIKKDLPALPRHITLVTSPNGAAVHDFIRIAQSRYPQIKISVYPVSVQGEQAAGDIRQALIAINRQISTDAIVLCRGGGSIEDLQAFNDEQLAREIRRSSIPVVNAVGHEIDYTIADFAADLRAPTPSGAAEMLVPDRTALAEQLKALSGRLQQTMQNRLDRLQDQITLYRHQLTTAAQPVDNLMLRLDQLANNLLHAMNGIITAEQATLAEQSSRLQQQNPIQALTLFQQNLENLNQRMLSAGSRIIREKQQALARAAGLLDAVSPLSTLARGYAIARKRTARKTVITGSDQVKGGEEIEVVLQQGRLHCTVNERLANSN